jgi:hypothetical protein
LSGSQGAGKESVFCQKTTCPAEHAIKKAPRMRRAFFIKNSYESEQKKPDPIVGDCPY